MNAQEKIEFACDAARAQAEAGSPRDAARKLFDLLSVARRAGDDVGRMKVLLALCDVATWTVMDDAIREEIGLDWRGVLDLATELEQITHDEVAIGYMLIANDCLGNTAEAESLRAKLNYRYPSMSTDTAHAMGRYFRGESLSEIEKRLVEEYGRAFVAGFVSERRFPTKK